MTPWHSVPDPWPFDTPQQITDRESSDLIDNGSPNADRVFAALEGISSRSVYVVMLLLGRGYRRGEQTDEVYVVSVKTNRRELLARFAAMPTLTNASSRAQLELSRALYPETPGEHRRLVLGWAFRAAE